MITKLNTDEELSQTSNLTHENDLTFNFTAVTIPNNNTQTQPVPNTLHSVTK